MNKYNNPRLLNAVVSGTGMKHPIQPHVVVGDVSNGFIRGDLMDANAIVDLVKSGDAIDQETIRQAVADIIGTAPENLDTLGEIVEALDAAVLDPNTEGSLANQISVINTTIEDNELTIAAALNDLNSRLLELVTRVDALDGGGDTPSQTQRIAFVIDSRTQECVIGYLQDNILKMYEANGQSNLLLVKNGSVSNLSGPPDNESVLNSYKTRAINAGFEVETVGTENLNVQLGDSIDNWEEYTIIGL